ncbi:MAG: class I SAM-dependent methyltransferase, partial [Thermodesulfobacteriota bacterium]
GDVDLNSKIVEKVQSESTTVDLGCGTGELLFELISKTQDLIGVDSSVNMLDQAKKRIGSINESVDLRLGELEHLPLKDEEVDCAVLNMVLHYISVPSLGMQEVYRVLRPGGKFIIVDFDKHQQEWVREKFGGPWLGFNKQEIRAWLEETGFALQDMEQIAVNKGLTINIFLAEKD